MKVTVNDPAEKKAFKPVEFCIRCESMDDLRALFYVLDAGTKTDDPPMPVWKHVGDFWNEINKAIKARE